MARSRIYLKTPEQIALMREAGRVVAEILDLMDEMIVPGVTTGQLDRIADEYIRAKGGVPSFKGYHGFRGSICVSVNDVVVHGIPGDRVLLDGDIIALDVGVILNGWHGDAARTYAVGNIDAESRRLMDVCLESLNVGIAAARPGRRLTDISFAIEQVVNAASFQVVHDLFGHGIGRDMHEAPWLPHYGPPGQGPELRPGMVFTIEPMIVAGSRAVHTLPDGWTIVTDDHSRSAQYEHTIAITENGPEILTLP
ncbi:MAG TPA: type I methionyl aminopeptidase [Thermomicrobiales bacterium]|nr:type I methionyl aminopeptidase [Thermomicrobiales bacterium]